MAKEKLTLVEERVLLKKKKYRTKIQNLITRDKITEAIDLLKELELDPDYEKYILRKASKVYKEAISYFLKQKNQKLSAKELTTCSKEMISRIGRFANIMKISYEEEIRTLRVLVLRVRDGINYPEVFIIDMNEIESRVDLKDVKKVAKNEKKKRK